MLGKNKIKKEIEMKPMQAVSFKEIEAKRPSWIKADNITDKEIETLITDWLTKNKYTGPLSFYKFITELEIKPPLHTPPATPRVKSKGHEELSDIF